MGLIPKAAKGLATLLIGGTSFTMCMNGPVPEGCCEPGDQLNIVVGDAVHEGMTPQERCDWMGGRLNGLVCEDVDF
jgi:hypothetical protein